MGIRDQIAAPIAHAHPIGPRGVAVGFLHPFRNIPVRQVMQAGPAVRRDAEQPVRQLGRATMNGAGELHGAAAEQPDLVLGPIIRMLIVFAEHIVTRWQGVDIGARRGEFSVDEPDRLGAQAFVIIEEQDPFVPALGQGEGAGVLDRRRPGNRHHAVHEAGGTRHGIIRRGFIDEDDFVGEGQGPQACGDQRGPVVRNDKSAEARPPGCDARPSRGHLLIRHAFCFSIESRSWISVHHQP